MLRGEEEKSTRRATSRNRAALLGLLLFVGCTSDTDGREPSPSIDAIPSPSPSEVEPAEVELPPIESIEDADGVAIEASPQTDWVLVAYGRAWVSDFAQGVLTFDAKSGRPLDTVPLRGTCAAMDSGFGAIWTATCQTLGIAKIDAKSGKVTGQLELAVNDRGEYSVGAGEGAVWAITNGEDCFSCEVARIDPQTVEVTDTFSVPEGASAIRAGEGGVWLTYFFNDEVLHLDPATGEVVASIRVADGPLFFDVGGGSVWVMAQTSGAYCQIDAARDELVGCTVVDPAGISGGDLTFGDGFVWLRATDELVAQIDPETGEVVRRIGEGEGSGSASAGSGNLWISAHDVSKLYRVPV